MKLKEFNTSNSKFTSPGEPTLRINSKAGMFDFSKAAASLLKLDNTSKVLLIQDEDSPSDWYVKVSNAETAFPIRNKENTSSYVFNCTLVAKSILASIKPDLKPVYIAYGFKISKIPEVIEGENYWVIITVNPLKPR